MNEMIDEILASCKDEISKSINHQLNEYMVVRAGRANPHILDKVFIDYYGVPTPLKNMASITVPEARMLCVSVWDQSQVKNVVKAISMADLGVTPNDDGKVIRLVFPILTEERRKELCYEGQRWFDLRRYGMPSIQHKWEGKIYTLTKNDPSYVLPIPPNVLQRNLLLEQNPFGPERVGVSITN